jgi:hypothetical protein
MSSRLRTPVIGLLVLAVLLGVAAVARVDGAGGRPCRAVERVVDPSPLHVVGNADVTYALSPPTSGPHQLPAPAAGVYDVAIPEPLQVGALESGLVIVQYDASLGDAGRETLVAAARGGSVIVAPAVRAIDEGAHVALTAWGVRQLCDEVDIKAVSSFIDDRAGAYFVTHAG